MEDNPVKRDEQPQYIEGNTPYYEYSSKAEYNSPCVNSIVSAFDDTPTQKPSDACVAGMGEPNFV